MTTVLSGHCTNRMCYAMMSVPRRLEMMPSRNVECLMTRLNLTGPNGDKVARRLHKETDLVAAASGFKCHV